MKRLFSFLLALMLLFSLTACGGEKSAGKVVYAMDTVMNLTAYGKQNVDALNAAESALAGLDQQLDRHSADSAVSMLNKDGYSEDSVLVQLLSDAVYLSELTGGAFDPTLAPVLDAWGFGTETPRVPNPEELNTLLEKTGTDHITFSDNRSSVTVSDGIAIDLGGIAKGYAGDCVKEIFENYGCTGVIDLGGDVALVGTKSGKPWRIAVKDPADTEKFLGVLEASDVFVVTSGVYERGFTENDTYYHHIIDPKTLYPADSGLVSVTVICSDGSYADALSTAAFVMGVDGALGLQNIFADDVSTLEFIFVTDDGRVLYTSGLVDSFTPSEEGSYTYECIVEAN